MAEAGNRRGIRLGGQVGVSGESSAAFKEVQSARRWDVHVCLETHRRTPPLQPPLPTSHFLRHTALPSRGKRGCK